MRQTTQWETIRKVLRYIRRYRILLASVNVFGTLMIPKLVGEAVDQMLGTGQVFYEGLFAILWQIALFTAMAAIAQWFMNLSNNKMTYSVVRDLRRDALEKIETLPLSYLDIHPAGEIESRIIADADQFADRNLSLYAEREYDIDARSSRGDASILRDGQLCCEEILSFL